MISTQAGGHGTRSLFPDFTPYYNDDTDGARDRKGAEALLDEAGWVLDEATGVRSKDGQELTVDLVAYASVHKIVAVRVP